MDTYRNIGLFSNEANKEAEQIKRQPLNFLDAKGNPIRGIGREAGLAVYMMTMD